MDGGAAAAASSDKIKSPILTVSPSAMWIFVTFPANGLNMGTVALSVSKSKIICSTSITSPSAT